MALEEYLGAVILEVDGQEIECDSVDVTHDTGRKLVKTMNRTGRAKGFCRGIQTFDIKVTVIIPVSGELDWNAIEGGKLTIYPQTAGGQRITYQDVFTLKVGSKYAVDNEAKRDLELAALREVPE